MLAPPVNRSVLAYGGASGLEVDRPGTTGEALLSAPEPLAARHRPAGGCAATWPLRVQALPGERRCPLTDSGPRTCIGRSSGPAGSTPCAPRNLQDRRRNCLFDSNIESTGSLRLRRHRGLRRCRSKGAYRNPAAACAWNHRPSKRVPDACRHGLRNREQCAGSGRRRLLTGARGRPPTVESRGAKLVTAAPWLAWCRLRHPRCGPAADRTRAGLMLSEFRQTRCAARAFPPNST